MSPQPSPTETSPPRDELSTDDNELVGVEQISKTLFRLTLTRANRADILSYGASKLDDNQEEAELLLENLQRWAPGEFAGSFARRSAAAVVEDTTLRVICSSEGGPFDPGFRIREYLAVSYCWHSEKWLPLSSPDDDGPDDDGPGAEEVGRRKDQVASPWPIFGHFAEALLKERAHPREGIWMDQLCINQDDDAEKQRAIAAMDVIYKSCRKMVVLLEDVELSEDEVRIAAKYELSPENFDVKTGRDSVDTADFPALFSFYDTVERARWWQRAWCFHEFVVIEPWTDKRHSPLDKTVVIMGSPNGGTVSIPFITVQRILVIAIQNRPYTRSDLSVLKSHLSGLSNDLSPYRDESRRTAGTMRTSIAGQYNAVASKGCSIATDRLAVIINMSGLSITYTGRALDEEEVYVFAVALALAAGETSPLSSIGSKDVMLHGRPSWISWTGAPEDLAVPRDMALPRFTLNTLPGIHRISSYEFELDMIFFNSLPHQPTEDDIRATYDIFPDLIRGTLPAQKVGQPGPQFFGDEQLDPYRRALLALAMGLQPSCMGRLWTAIYRDIVKVKLDTVMFNTLEPNQGLLPQARAFLSHISALAQPPVDNGEVDEGHAEQNFDLEAATFFLTCLTDNRTLNYLGFLPSRLQCAAAGAQALVSNVRFNSHFSSRDLRELRGAIPTALVGPDCLPYRMWILKPVQTDSSSDGGGIGDGGSSDDAAGEPRHWRVVGKAMLLGEPDLYAELESHSGGGVLTMKRNQVIVG
ncbi:hypothetical protein SLS62_002328 [Diatrype stigma]|uniref:Heterokaryon incompatibility domain-containing protein n=1 Tax=Diatrype stigma TaxID=117547 RepID=A0AAN9UY47_9PEZI